MCEGGHVFICGSGNTSYPVMEGQPCVCGLAYAHFEPCQWCGQMVLKAVLCKAPQACSGGE